MSLACSTWAWACLTEACSGGGAGLLDLDLLGAVLRRTARPGPGTGRAAAGPGGRHSAARGRWPQPLATAALAAAALGDGGVVLLLGDDVLLDERGVAVDVELGLDGVGLGLVDAGLGGLDLLLRLGD